MDTNKIIENLPKEIFAETYNSEDGVQPSNKSMSGEAVYDEQLPSSLAMSLLPSGEYDNTCQYVLSQSNDVAVVIKRRDGDEPILQEYPLESKDNVMSMDDMLLEIQRVKNGVRDDVLHVDTRVEPDKPKPLFIIPVAVIVVLLFVGLYIFVSLVR